VSVVTRDAEMISQDRGKIRGYAPRGSLLTRQNPADRSSASLLGRNVVSKGLSNVWSWRMSGVIRISKPTGPADRRAHQRVRLRVPVLVDSHRAWQKCQATDISLGGLALCADQQLESGAAVEVYFELPNGVMIEAPAHAVRTEGPVLGVRFDALTPEQSQGVRAYIALSRQSEVAIRFSS
jgi:hypothetical protein